MAVRPCPLAWCLTSRASPEGAGGGLVALLALDMRLGTGPSADAGSDLPDSEVGSLPAGEWVGVGSSSSHPAALAQLLQCSGPRFQYGLVDS